MRVLFCAQPGTGHWRPLAPFAQALQSSGHEVAFAVTPISAQEIERHGFHCFPIGIDDWQPGFQEQMRALELPTVEANGIPYATDEVPPATIQPAEAVWLNTFLPRAKHNLPELLDICRSWRPDLIVREQTEFGGWLAAERLGVPHAAVQVSGYRPWLNQLIAPALDRLRSEAGLSSEPSLSRLYPYLWLLPFPPSLVPSEPELPPSAHFIQSTSYDLANDDSTSALDWLSELPNQPTVYATLGTAYNKDLRRFLAIIDALGHEPVNLILTTNDIDPALFADIVREQPRPGAIRVESYLPQSLILPHCDLVFSHGGLGTVRAALAHGLPQVIMPIAADQPDNARRCVELGIGEMIEPDQRGAPAIRDAVMTVLDTPSYRERAQAIQREFLALPDVHDAVRLMERCASTG